jgi:hypothetical protein
MSTSIKLAQAHEKEFGEQLDPEELFTFAAENRLPLKDAYTKMTRETRDQKTKELWEKRVEEAKQEGAKEFASSHNMPVLPRKTGAINPIDPPEGMEIPKTHRDRVAAAVSAWRQRE